MVIEAELGRGIGPGKEVGWYPCGNALLVYIDLEVGSYYLLIKFSRNSYISLLRTLVVVFSFPLRANL